MTAPAPAFCPADDQLIDQGWQCYSADDHAMWRALFERQSRLLPGRACEQFLRGLDRLGIAADGIPDFERLSELLHRATGWRAVAVPGLVADDVFFWHLAHRRFPAANWIRSPKKMDYLQEPDVFHDVFGHVPMLIHPVFAEYMAAYGQGGLKALRLDALTYLARLYWYTVEFGLIATEKGLRIYGSGIVSSLKESRYALDSDAPKRIAFDLLRVMRTNYRIDDLQDNYFVIDGFDQLFAATLPDFTGYYCQLRECSDIEPGTVLPEDRLVEAGR